MGHFLFVLCFLFMVKDVSSQHRLPDTVPAAMLSATMALSLGNRNKQTLSGISFLDHGMLSQQQEGN